MYSGNAVTIVVLQGHLLAGMDYSAILKGYIITERKHLKLQTYMKDIMQHVLTVS